ncbi:MULTISPECIES: hypothetical protein [unclassified Arthrobacter]|uniref:hypothetical protein n=1 Tax=unclassified Arthrobacter TaxID=235627 RepID=UPI002882FC2F|nr:MULTISPECIES: hypothetical protein [unclassified Arthrobacter]
MDESIPRALQPPVAVALAKLVKDLPGSHALPGASYCEPKWDGYIHWTSSSPPGSDAPYAPIDGAFGGPVEWVGLGLVGHLKVL